MKIYFNNASIVFRLLSACAMLLFLCVQVRAESTPNDSIAKFTNLNEITVTPGKTKYSKKNNPAVSLINKVRNSKDFVDPFSQPYYSFNKYSRLSLGLNKFSDVQSLSRKTAFLQDYIDTLSVSGQPYLKLALKETLSKRIFRNKPHADKEIIEARRNVGIDDSFNQDNIFKTLDDLLKEINIYDSDIMLLQNSFVGPLSPLSNDFYKFFLTDSVSGNGITNYEIAFSPKNPESFTFSGLINITANDSVAYINQAILRVPSSCNINFIQNLVLSQTFNLNESGKLDKTADRINAAIRLFDGSPTFIAEKITFYDNFSNLPQDSLSAYYSKLGYSFTIDDFDRQSLSFWNQHRMVPLSRADANMSSLLPKLRRYPVFRWGEQILKVLAEGYIPIGHNAKFDLGPVNTFASYNSLEGVRLRAGGLTTTNLSKNIFAGGYIAYGFRDRKIKYDLFAEYSFIPKKRYSGDFPINALRIEHKYDVDMIGQHYLFTNPDNVFLSFRRKKSDLGTYRRLSQLSYTLELKNNLSFSTTLRYETQYASPFINFKDGNGLFFAHYNQASLKFSLRYAPGEKYVQGHTSRQPINFDAPIFNISHEIGPKGLFGSLYFLNKTEISAFNRFRLSAFGTADVTLKAGILWNQVQFPSLTWQNANLSYTVRQESYSLMNPMEFANDRYASIDLTYRLNGLIFNRIPFVNKARIRELFTFKALWGHLTDKNNPDLNPELFRFPLDANTHKMTNTPYIEIGAGLDNIFSILRIDYVWRVTYLNHPGIDRHGLRIALNFSF